MRAAMTKTPSPMSIHFLLLSCMAKTSLSKVNIFSSGSAGEEDVLGDGGPLDGPPRISFTEKIAEDNLAKNSRRERASV
jgi:hypothetical protein